MICVVVSMLVLIPLSEATASTYRSVDRNVRCFTGYEPELAVKSFRGQDTTSLRPCAAMRVER